MFGCWPEGLKSILVVNDEYAAFTNSKTTV